MRYDSEVEGGSLPVDLIKVGECTSVWSVDRVHRWPFLSLQ